MVGCIELPRRPFKVHESIKDAKKYLKSCGKTNINEIVYENSNARIN
jgi:hypothetical protein